MSERKKYYSKIFKIPVSASSQSSVKITIEQTQINKSSILTINESVELDGEKIFSGISWHDSNEKYQLENSFFRLMAHAIVFSNKNMEFCQNTTF